MDVSGKLIGAIGIVIITIFLLALTPTVVSQVQDMDTSGWNFTGYQGAVALLGLVPFVWVAMILIGAVVGMFVLAKRGGGQ
jgi:NADH:ubiquinone oxidoreductase subunit 6 (subunit J)